MKERFKASLSGIWLAVSFFALMLPVFLPSAVGAGRPVSDVIGTATVAMFLLSFPSSLFAIPVMMIVYAAFGIYPNEMGAMYLNLLFLFVLGVVQWFWIVPRVWMHSPAIQTIELPAELSSSFLKPVPEVVFSAFDSRGETPVERVIRESE